MLPKTLTDQSAQGIAYQYDVEPFSGKDFHRQSGKVKDPNQPCAICGRPVDVSKARWAIVASGGARWGTPTDDYLGNTDPGFMGWFPIGPDCHRRHLLKTLPSPSSVGSPTPPASGAAPHPRGENVGHFSKKEK